MTLKCHSSQVHYNLFHEDKHPQCVQHSSTSLFFINNDHSHCHCQPGFNFWQDFCVGLGAGIGNGLGGFINSFLGCNFGFGMPMMGCFGNLYGGISMPNPINSLPDYNKAKNNADRRADYSRYAVSYSKSKIETGDPEPLVKSKDPDEDKVAEIKIGEKAIEVKDLTADDIGKITKGDFSEYNAVTKNAIVARLKDLPLDENKTDIQNIANNTDLPDDIVKAARGMLYIKGATNWNGTDDINTIKFVTDTSRKTKNVIPVPELQDNVKVSDGDPITIEIIHFVDVSNNDKKTVTYKYEGTVNKYGEYVFKSQVQKEENKKQEYILQKLDDSFILAQYSWHTGFGIKDVDGTGSSNQ
ncbi:hypothetical protein IKB17_01320 [bacterium]|nr:hypothetical protein [bacterium]